MGTTQLPTQQTIDNLLEHLVHIGARKIEVEGSSDYQDSHQYDWYITSANSSSQALTVELSSKHAIIVLFHTTHRHITEWRVAELMTGIADPAVFTHWPGWDRAVQMANQVLALVEQWNDEYLRQEGVQ